MVGKEERKKGGKEEERYREEERREREGRVIRLRNELICIWYGYLALLPHQSFLST